jgi:hypothetical protein
MLKAFRSLNLLKLSSILSRKVILNLIYDL